MAVPNSEAVQWLPSGSTSAESRSGRIGPIILEAKQTGERSAGNPHAAFDEAGAGNVARPRWCDTRRRKSEPTGNTNFGLNRRASPRPYLSFRGQVRGAQGLLPCFPATALIPWRPPPLARVPVSPVPRGQRYYEGATTSRLRVPGRLSVSLPGSARSSAFRARLGGGSRRHGDRRSDHSRRPHHRPRPARGRTVPQPHQPGDRRHPDPRPDRDCRQQRQGRRRHLRLFAGGRKRHRVSDMRLGFGRQLFRRAGDARRRDDRHGDPAAVDPRRHRQFTQAADRLDRWVLLAEQDPGIAVTASRPLSEHDPDLHAATDKRSAERHFAIAVEPELDRRPQRQSGLEQERGAAFDARLDLGCGLLPRFRSPERVDSLARERHANRQHAELRGPVAVPPGRHRPALHLLELIARQAQNLCLNLRRPDLAGRQRRHADRHVHGHGWRRHDGEAVPGAELYPDSPPELRRQSLPDPPRTGPTPSAA